MNITIKQLMAATPKTVQNRISGLNIHDKTKKVWFKPDKAKQQKSILRDAPIRHNGRKARGFFCDASLHNDQSSGTKYRLMIKNFGTKREPENWLFKEDALVWVHCSCPYFKYYLEVALWTKECTDLLSLGGENAYRPKMRNPKMKAYLCKHLYSTLVFLIKQDRKKQRYQGPF